MRSLEFWKGTNPDTGTILFGHKTVSVINFKHGLCLYLSTYYLKNKENSWESEQTTQFCISKRKHFNEKLIEHFFMVMLIPETSWYSPMFRDFHAVVI